MPREPLASGNDDTLTKPVSDVTGREQAGHVGTAVVTNLNFTIPVPAQVGVWQATDLDEDCANVDMR